MLVLGILVTSGAFLQTAVKSGPKFGHFGSHELGAPLFSLLALFWKANPCNPSVLRDPGGARPVRGSGLVQVTSLPRRSRLGRSARLNGWHQSMEHVPWKGHSALS